MKISYNYCLESMFKLKRFGIKLGLDTIKYVLRELDNPQENFFSIHIAGSNGKGSVASNLSKILQKSGYKVGLYTSPHLINFNERICINGIPIKNKSIINLWQKIKSIPIKTREMTFFEFATVMAFCEFKQNNINFAIIETGMGGRLDATNIISPILTIITNISIEHKKYLGNTIEKITKEKAGIIKPYIPIISGVTQPKAIETINKISKEKKSKFFLKERDFKSKKNNNKFNYLGIYNNWKNMSINLLGDHQIDNASITLAACEILNLEYTNLSLNNINLGLLTNKWEGRLEIICDNPYIILDGAHNLSAAKKLRKFLEKHLKNIVLIIGILEDKPYDRILKELAPICANIIVTKPNNERAVSVNKMEKAAKKYNNNIKAINNIDEAIEYTIKNFKKNNSICIAGSLYTIGEAKKEFIKKYKKNKNHKFIIN